MSTPDHRKHERINIVKAIECTAYHHMDPPSEFDCFIANISQSGVCLMTTEALQNGQDIRLRNHILPTPRSATVRWLRRERNGLYY
ncbi:MAG TPA: PilZ domain-containing protein, partial [Thermodesulfovibrionales bacterium]|nr:PilZ domain-containing protein [Thermodesulfovibrionales bacterium]